MNLTEYVAKYGTEGTSIVLRMLARELVDKGSNIHLQLVNEMADELRLALHNHLESQKR